MSKTNPTRRPSQPRDATSHPDQQAQEATESTSPLGDEDRPIPQSKLPYFLEETGKDEDVYIILPNPEEDNVPLVDTQLVQQKERFDFSEQTDAEPSTFTDDLQAEPRRYGGSLPAGKRVTSWPPVTEENEHTIPVKQTRKKRSFHNLKPSIVLIIILAGIGCGIWYWNNSQHIDSQFQLAMVSRGDLTKVVTATGQLNPRITVQVSSQISGIIHQVFVDFNSTVKKQDVLAELDSATYNARVKMGEGELAEAKAAVELAQVEAARMKELRANDLASQSDLDKTLTRLHQAEATLKVKEAILQNANVDLARCTIYAPMDGVVISRNVDVGQTVAASLSAPTLFVIANDLTRMQIDSNVSEADIGEVKEGQESLFTVDAFSQRKFRGKVIQVRNAPITIQNVVTYDCVIEVTNSDLRLKPGMTANISIIIARRLGVLKIPNACLRVTMPEAIEGSKKAGSISKAEGTENDERKDGSVGEGAPPEKGKARRTVYVFPKDNVDGKPRPVEIKIGISDGVETEVAKGLNEGDQVVSGTRSGHDRVNQTQNLFGRGVRKL